MSLAFGLGAVGLVAAVWAVVERRRGAVLAADRDTANASVALAKRETAAANATVSALTVRLEETERDLVVWTGQARRMESTLADLRRAVAEGTAERERLAHLVEDAQLVAAERSNLERERDALRVRLEAGERALLHARDQAGRSTSRAFFARMEELDRLNQELTARVDTWARRAQSAEGELTRREGAGAGDPVALERDALRGRAEALESALRRGAQQRASLKVLGVPEPARDAGLFLPERRGATEAAVRDVYIAAQAVAAALVDARGAVWSRYGPALVTERLAASIVLMAACDADGALGGRVRLVSESFGVYGRHLVRLPDTEVWLGLTGSRECPALALRLAALRLAGLGGASTALPTAGEAPPLDPALSDRLDAWVTKRRALAGAVLGGAEPAASESSFAGACAPLVRTVRALSVRSARDGFGEGFGVAWRGDDDVTLAARLLPDGRVAFARFAAPPAPRVLDDLVATVRWQPAALPAPS